jgi:hypothetical protein
VGRRDGDQVRRAQVPTPKVKSGRADEASPAAHELNTYVQAIGRDSYLCHEGDWEHVTICLNPEDELGEPLEIGFAAHGKKSAASWAELDKDDGRLVVYSGRGSDASLPKPGKHWNSGDVGDADGLRWETWERLEPVTQNW